MVNVTHYGVPKSYTHCDLKDAYDREAANILSQFIEGEITNVAIKGGPSTGKTFLSCAVVSHLLRNLKIHSYRAEAQTLVSEFHAGVKWQIPDKYLQTKVLVLENLGRESTSESTHKAVERVVIWRVENGKKTIITTGYNGDVLERTYGPAFMEVIKNKFKKIELQSKGECI